MFNINCLRIANWNGRSVHGKKLEFFDFLERHDVDVAIVTETWLQEKLSFYHPKFSIVRIDRNSDDAERGGGVLIAIRKGIAFKELDVSTKVVETTGVSIDAATGGLHIFAAYFPGARRRSAWTQFRRDISTLTRGTQPFIVVGDLNARHRSWNCARANKAGTTLWQEAIRHNFFIHFPDTFTFYPPGRGRPSTLDLTLSNNLLDMTKPIVLNELSSDHRPVLFDVSLTAPIELSTPKFRCYARADWSRFQREINLKLDLQSPVVNEILSEANVDTAIEFLTTVLLDAEAAAVPEVQQRSYQTATIPESTRNLIALRNLRRRQWYRRRDPIYQDIVSSLNRRIREECDQANFNRFKETLRTLHDDRDTLWRISKALRKTTKYSPPLRQGDNIIASSSEKAQLLATSFARAHTNQMVDDAATVTEVNNSIVDIDRTPLAGDHPWLVRPKEVALFIRRLKSKKTPGQDELRNIVLKRLPRKAHIFLAKIFSACIRLGYFPTVWKHAVVTAIPKPNKDSSNPSNYRPISLLPTLSKLLERVILNRIEQHLENTRIIPDAQFGFKRGHSTNHQLVRLVKEVRTKFARRKSSGMVLLDVEKAYDSVWQEAILHKMRMAVFPLYVLKIVRSFLQNRSFHVAVNGHASNRHGVPFGVPQGAVLSPTLYNIFMADLAMIDGVSYFLFADDTGFIASDADPDIVVTKLQAAQNAIERYQKKWKVKTNAEKSQAIFFTRKRSPRNLPRREVSVWGSQVPWSEDVKYLGLTLDRKLTFAAHMKNTLTKCDKITRMLYSLISRRSHLDVNSKLLLYKTVFKPSMTYGFPAWYDCAASHRKKLQVKQNRLLKMMLNLGPFHPTDDVHRMAKIQLIDDWLLRVLPKFWTGCATSANPLLQRMSA